MTIQKGKTYRPKNPIYGFTDGLYEVKSIDKNYIYCIDDKGNRNYIVKERFLEYEEASNDGKAADLRSCRSLG